jgi:leader peptidase (prepilin peptidase) / N-methyltransferase
LILAYNIILWIIIFAFGLAFGSLANVCIYRIPREESIVTPPSHCPGCNKQIEWYDNIPLLSFLLLLGKCRHCKTKISWQYPIIEFITGILFTLVFIRYHFSSFFFLDLILIFYLVIISGIDFHTQLIPDVLSLPLAVVGLAVSFINPNLLIVSWKLHVATFYSFHMRVPFPVIQLISSIIGLLAGGGLLYLIAWASRGGMGGGDIKLAGAIGAFLGWENVLWSLGVAFLIGGIVALILLILGLKGRKDPVPFGPFIALGAVIVILFLPYLRQLLFYNLMAF